MKNKGGFAFSIVLFMAIFLIALFLILQIPFPFLKNIKIYFNYWLSLLAWVLIQIGLIWVYFELINYAVKGFKLYDQKLKKWGSNLEKFVSTHK